MINVIQVEASALRGVRHKVLWPFMNSLEEAVIDIDQSEGAIHLAGVVSGKIVGCASLFIQDCHRYPEFFDEKKVYRLRAMGVDQELQGSGVGAAIIKEAEEACSRKGVKVIWCDAREIAWGFYTKQGFKFACQDDGYECEAYKVRNVGLHKMMYKRI